MFIAGSLGAWLELLQVLRVLEVVGASIGVNADDCSRLVNLLFADGVNRRPTPGVVAQFVFAHLTTPVISPIAYGHGYLLFIEALVVDHTDVLCFDLNQTLSFWLV
jgi:hypothetical protein